MRLPVLIVFSFAIASFILTPCHAQHASHSSDDVITIRGEDYALQAPDEIPSGWTTINYLNEGEEEHFLFFGRLPEGKSMDDYAADVLVPINEIWYAIRDEGLGFEEAMEQLGGSVPEWFWAVEFLGGAGVIEPGASSEVTLNLKPGTYFLECYMKNEDGELHSMEGMIREMRVTDERSTTTPPQADITVTLSNFEMDIDGALTAGTHTVAVHVKENPEEGFGHNLHVARLADNMEAEDVMPWMNFFDPAGLQTPAPTSFHGGMHLLPAGETGYFKLDLEPGRYLFVSEYTAAFGVWQEVTVAP